MILPESGVTSLIQLRDRYRQTEDSLNEHKKDDSDIRAVHNEARILHERCHNRLAAEKVWNQCNDECSQESGTQAHDDDGTDSLMPKCYWKTTGPKPFWYQKIHGAYDEVMKTCLTQLPEQGAGEKDAGLLVNQLFVYHFLKSNGQRACMKILDCGPCGRNSTILGGWAQ